MPQRSPKPKRLLSVRALEVLKAMRSDPEANGELVCSGIEVWVGLERTSHSILKKLLQLCLVSKESNPGGYDIYILNSDGRQIIDDPTYEPPIVDILRKKAGTSIQARDLLDQIGVE